ncbi:UDP-N-acetylmuramoyl-L-alanyl-D-glutamate--2,6-diaminopimelate ligase [Aquirhabdus parva]|nr:UDP-N-acetylmuramoyl-L-alanyl-D-glutamate--2,6-diaminopimelate ligase [Aquirhabdus parva]
MMSNEVQKQEHQTATTEGIALSALLETSLLSEPLNPELAKVRIQSLAIDSRQVQAGTLFFAIKGTAPGATLESLHSKIATFIQSALDHGAGAVLSEVKPDILGLKASQIIYVPHLRQHIGAISKRFNQLTRPVQTPLRVAAVTGTNGKTTVTRLLAELLTLSGRRSAVLGTTGNGILPNLVPSSHTTVDALQLQNKLHDYAEQGAVFACLEASSHGLEQGRLAATPVEVAIFTNLTRDHLDYHGTFEAYAAAKAILFDPAHFPDLKYVVINANDSASERMLSHLSADIVVWRYATNLSNAESKPDFYIINSTFSLKGAILEVQTPFGIVTLHSPLLGRFNVANLLAAVAGALALGLTLPEIVSAVPQIVGAAGRMQLIADESLLLIVDYAHTPDAITQVLASLRPHTAGSLTCVFGCGGDRDRGKRPLMTRAALEAADRVIVTSDNPRTEAIDAIIADMLHGLSAAELARITVEPNRRQAIQLAVRDSHAGDAVVVAGKGHEDYQEIDGVRHWFDDAVELAQARQALLALPSTSDATQN